MKVFVFTDLEGVSGVCRFTQTREPGVHYEEARRLLMGDLNACIDGLVDAGVTDIVTVDGHGRPYNFVPELLHPKARHTVGGWYDKPIGLDPDCDAIILLGHHAMAGTPDGVLYHTQSSRSGNRYWYNGRESGEMAQEALIAGHYGTPLIMVTGDDATCREARAFFGDGPVAVSVKKGQGRESAVLLAPKAAHEIIRAGARESVARMARCKPYKIDLPIAGRLAFAEKATADGFKLRPGTKRVDDFSFEATFQSQLDILKF